MIQSIYTEYHDEQHCSPSRVSNMPIKKLSPVRSREQLYISRLEGKVKDLKAQIHKNKPLLEQIRKQRKFFKKISDKQRTKIEQTNIPQMKTQYQGEINKLQKEKVHLQEIIALIHQESNMKINDFVEAKSGLRDNKAQLEKMLIDIKEQNAKYIDIIQLKDAAIKDLELGLSTLKKEIGLKQRVRQKYNEAVSAIGQLEERKREGRRE